ncbi:MAG: hypothetical protein PHH30_07170 [Bacteroidales bacterium]|nr:hypothetical protein [Bacteroidales bacterium]
MKKIVFVVLVICFFANIALAQESSNKSKEFYFTLPMPFNITTINPEFSLKTQVKDNFYIDYNLINLSFRYGKTGDNTNYNYAQSIISYSGGVGIGFEWRKNISSKLQLYYGPGLFASYFESISIIENSGLPIDDRKQSNQQIEFGIPFNLGLIFNVSDKIAFSAGINPVLSMNIDYRKYPSLTSTTQSFGLNFTDEIASVSLIIRR